MSKSADPALDWLRANDPLASGRTDAAWAREIGIVSSTLRSDVQEHEIGFSDPDGTIGEPHCAACFIRRDVRTHTVE